MRLRFKHLMIDRVPNQDDINRDGNNIARNRLGERRRFNIPKHVRAFAKTGGNKYIITFFLFGYKKRGNEKKEISLEEKKRWRNRKKETL